MSNYQCAIYAKLEEEKFKISAQISYLHYYVQRGGADSVRIMMLQSNTQKTELE